MKKNSPDATHTSEGAITTLETDAPVSGYAEAMGRRDGIPIYQDFFG